MSVLSRILIPVLIACVGQAHAGEARLILEPVFRLKAIQGSQRFITQNEYEFHQLKPQIEVTAFLAVCTNFWPSGLVPIFSIEQSNQFHLRRRAPSAQENYTEPLFFALPLENETNAAKLTGRWECVADRTGGTKDYPAWELTVDGELVRGRFDQNTQYRYGFLTGGIFRSNRLDLRVDYMNEAWFLTGHLRDGKLMGEWHREDRSEGGAWEAVRPRPITLSQGEPVALYEWKRVSDNARRYAIEGENFGPEWERVSKPLCRVWRSKRADELTTPNPSR